MIRTLACVLAVLAPLAGAAADCPDGTPPFTLIDPETGTRFTIVAVDGDVTRVHFAERGGAGVVGELFRGLLPLSEFDGKRKIRYSHEPAPGTLFPLLEGEAHTIVVRDDFGDDPMRIVIGAQDEVRLGACVYAVQTVDFYLKPEDTPRRSFLWSPQLGAILAAVLHDDDTPAEGVRIFRAETISVDPADAVVVQ